MDVISTKVANTMATNMSISSDGKKVRYSYILRKVLLVIILPLIITVICYHYAKQKA